MGRLRVRAVTTVAALVASTVTMVGLSGPASAAPSTVDTPFSYTGSVQNFTVPAGITQLTLTLTGAEGGHGGKDGAEGSPGGYKGVVSGTVTVTPGTVLSIGVGGGGQNGLQRSGASNNVTTPAGTNPLTGYAGGVGGTAGPEGASGNGGGGGAATVVTFGGTTLVAGGAGGGGGSGQFLPITGRPAEATPTPRTDAVATSGQPGADTLPFCSGRCDGGASGGGGGGAIGGARGRVEFGAGANNEYFGYGGYPGTSSTGGQPGLSAVYQYYAGNTANGSVVISYVTGSPAAPTSVAGTAGNASVDLTWTAPTATGGASVSDYVIEYSANGGTTWSTFSHAPSAATATTVTGLTNGTAYVFRASAVNSFGTGTASTVSGPVTPSNVPTAPTLGTVTPGNGSLTIAFSGATAASPITGYEYAVNGGAWTPAGTTTSPLTITGLTNGVTHEVQVRAVNAIGAGDASNGVVGTPATTPGAPSITTATTGPTSAVLVFSPGASGGSAVTGYQYSLNGGTWLDAGTTTSPITVTGLTDGTLYAARIRAVNALGTGAVSTPVNLTTSKVPGAPVIGAVTPLDGALGVAFTPAGTGGLAITGYEYQLDGGAWVATPSNASPLLISGLSNGTTYGVKIRATNGVGTGAASTTATGSPLTAPGAPVLTATTPAAGAETDDGSLDVSFTAPVATGGSPITGYEYSTDGGLTWRVRVTGSTDSPLTVSTLSSDGTTPLEVGVDYPVELRAVNAAGPGAASSILSAAGRTAPAAPVITEVAGRPGSLLVTVTPPANGGEAITGYEYRLDGGTWTSSGTAGPRFVIGGLTNGVSYGVEVRAVNAIDAGGPSAPATGTPGAVPGAAVIADVAPIDRALRITATVADDGGSAVTGWEYTTDGGLTWAAATGTTSPFTITHLAGAATLLDNGSSYAVAVRARNAVGAGGSSATVSAAPSATPSAPTITLTPGDGRLQVAYTIGSDGGSPLTDVQYRLAGGSWISAGTITSPFVVSGLTNGTAYPVELRGVNSRGAGAVSASVSSTPRTVPGAPTGVTLASENTSATVSWTAPASTGGSAVTGYTATAWTAPNGGTAVATCTSTTLTCSIPGLTNGTTYYVSVVATNVAGTGSASTPRVAVTPMARPSAPTLNAITPNNTYVSVDFTAGAAGSNPITGYQYQLNGGAWVNATGTTTPITISGLINGTAYVVALRAVSAAGPGAASTTLTATPFTLPDVPDSTTIVGTGGANTITVTWAAVNGNGRPVTAYNVVLWDAATVGSQIFNCATTGALSCTMNGPSPGTTYYATVTATNAAGTTARSAPRIPVASGTAPGAPTAVTGTSGDGQVSLSWTAGPAGSGAPTTDYAISYSTNGTTWTPFADGVSTNRTATVTGLTNGTPYTFRVQALSLSGSSPVSAASTAVTPNAPGTVPTFGTVTRTVDGFTAPVSNYNAVVGYTATATNGGIATITGSTLTVTGLAAGTASTVTVTATRAGYSTVTGTVSGAALNAGTPLTLSPPVGTSNGYQVGLPVLDPAVTYTATTTAGTVTLEGRTVTVTGLDPGASATVTVTATRPGYTTTTAQATGTALLTGVTPVLTAPVRTADGYTVSVVDPAAEYSYLAASSTGSATVDVVDGRVTVTVTGLQPGQTADVTVVAVRPGYTMKSATTTGTALQSGSAPLLSTPVSTDAGFTVRITDDVTVPVTDYTAVSTAGTVEIVAGLVTVTGLNPGQLASVTVTATRAGHTTATSTADGAALLAGTPISLISLSRTADGYTVDIDAPDPDVAYTAVSDVGTATVFDGVVTVAGLTPGQQAVVTVTATRAGHATTTATVSAAALATGITPTVTGPVRTADGFVVQYADDDTTPPTSYTATTSAGTLTDVDGVVTITGLTAGQQATVTVTATRDGYTTTTTTVAGQALETGTPATVSTPVRTAAGFTARITDSPTVPATGYTATSTAGSVEIVNGLITVTGLTPGQQATVTVTAAREGYTPGTTAVDGRALETGSPVVLSAASRSDFGYTVAIGDLDPTTDYTATVSAGSVDIVGDSVIVSGLAPDQSATVTVTATKTGFTTTTASATGAALRVGSLPTLSPVTPTRDGYIVRVLNVDPNSTYGANAGAGTASVTSVDGVVTVTVTGLAPEQSATTLVYATREGYSTLETPVTGTALAVGTAPTRPSPGSIDRTADGFTFPVTIPVTDPVTTFVLTSTAGVATLVDGVVTVTGLTPGQTATVTVAAVRAGHATESISVNSGALFSGTVPTVPPAPTRTDDGFAFAITDPVPGTTYTATSTAGVATVVDGIVTVTGLAPGQAATVTVTASRPGETPESVTVTGSALGTGSTPVLGPPTPNADGFTVTIANADPDTVYTATTTAGRVTVLDGVITVTGLAPGETATLTITATRPGFTPVTTSTTGIAPTPVQLTLAGGDTIVATTSTPVISGYADAPEGSPVTVTVNGQTLTTTVGADGFWSVTPAALPDGEYEVEVSITVLGVTSTVTQQLAVDTADDGDGSGPVTTVPVDDGDGYGPVTSGPTDDGYWPGTLPTTSNGAGGLAYTGLDTRLPGTVGVGLLVLGALFLGFARRRRPVVSGAADTGNGAPPAV